MSKITAGIVMESITEMENHPKNWQAEETDNGKSIVSFT
jgi:hypothetical protein